MAESFTPSQEILDKYADVLVNFGLNKCQGVKHNEVVFLQVPEVAKPLLRSLRKAVLKAGAHPIIQFMPDDMARDFYDDAQEHHLDFFPGKYLKGKVDEADHFIGIEADTNVKELEGIDPKKVMRKGKAMRQYRDWRNEKENQGKQSWTLALYGTEAMAKEAGLSLKEYWDQIINACYLDEENPVEHWKKTEAEIKRVLGTLNSLEIDWLKVKGEGIDLKVQIGKNRKWLGGRGANIPSFEVFISPDYRGTSGTIEFDQPLYRYGNLIKGVKLKFENGEVVESSASEGDGVLKEMIASDEGSSRVGEYSLTDKRLSRISKFMATTLYDENFGGELGNTHLALGSAYKDSFPGDQSKVSKEEWNDMGYNDSVVHTDIVSTKKREVTAVLASGEEKLIYRDGEFLI
jgi:aminopeptidase